MTHQTYFVLDIESGLEWTSYINGKQAERDEDGLLDASIEAETGDKVLMEVKAESSYEDSTLSYQWYKDDEKIKGATQSSYTATKQAATEYYAEEGVNDENYYCKISDGYTSAIAQIAVTRLLSKPPDKKVQIGMSESICIFTESSISHAVFSMVSKKESSCGWLSNFQ